MTILFEEPNVGWPTIVKRSIAYNSCSVLFTKIIAAMQCGLIE
jgi:hypothetical protein